MGLQICFRSHLESSLPRPLYACSFILCNNNWELLRLFASGNEKPLIFPFIMKLNKYLFIKMLEGNIIIFMKFG